MMEHTLYHQLLRVAAVVVAFVLVFDAGQVVPGTDKLSDNTTQYLANVVGVSVGIPESELNVITAELTEQRVALEERERVIAEREIQLQQNPNAAAAGGSNTSTFILSTILFILLALIVLNYGLDYARTRELEAGYAPST